MRVALLYPPPWKVAEAGEPPYPPGQGPPAGYREGDLDADFHQLPYALLALGAAAIRAGHQVKVLNLSGGVLCTVVGDSMQRAPVFVFDNARDARDFVTWVDASIDKIREEAEATSSVAKLVYIDSYLSN